MKNNADAKMLKKDQTDIVKPPKVEDEELLYVHTQEYLSSLQVIKIISLWSATEY